MKIYLPIFLVLCFVPAVLTSADGINRFHPGIHAGAGTDINLGLAVGVKASFLPLGLKRNPLEAGLEFFYSKSTEESNNGFNDYLETTELFIIGAMANVLFGYQMESPTIFYILGIGVSAVSVYWEEKSPTDSSLGEPYGDSGSMQSIEGLTGGTVLNLGLGYSFGKGFEARLELPIIIFFGEYGEASAVAPSLTLMGGYRF
ncbi:MAG: hypothetical protein JEY91_01065 [Spirochaetaceae bacterium]|nr:hypothetical protein [Spirochaetaceae bacterium]